MIARPKSLIFKLGFFFFWLILFSVAGCPGPDWVLNNGICYCSGASILYENQMSWDNAVQWCRERNSLLVYPKTQAEKDFVYNFSDSLSGGLPVDIWIGLNDKQTEGVFIWQDGSSLELSEQSWKPGSPDHLNADEDCVNLSPDGWDDWECNSFPSSIVCQVNEVVENTTSTQPTTLPSTVVSSPTTTQQTTTPPTVDLSSTSAQQTTTPPTVVSSPTSTQQTTTPPTVVSSTTSAQQTTTPPTVVSSPTTAQQTTTPPTDPPSDGQKFCRSDVICVGGSLMAASNDDSLTLCAMNCLRTIGCGAFFFKLDNLKCELLLRSEQMFQAKMTEMYFIQCNRN